MLLVGSLGPSFEIPFSSSFDDNYEDYLTVLTMEWFRVQRAMKL